MTIEKGTPEFAEFVRRGIHRLFCTPCEFITEGPPEKLGRVRWHRELLPALGETEGEWPCVCGALAIKVNGEAL